MNKWVFGRRYSKHKTRWLTVISCFELTPLTHAPHFHLIVEYPIDSKRAAHFSEKFIEEWCQTTGASRNAQQMEHETLGRSRAFAYITKHTALGHCPRKLRLTEAYVGEFDALNTRYQEPRTQ